MKKDGERYDKVFEQMELLGIQDVTTNRQHRNGTVVWRLPIKNNWPGNQKNATYIKVASFSTGYVRNQNSGYSNYQLNKRVENQPTYYKDYEWVDGKQKWTGKYRQFTTRGCKLIPIEIDRLEYLISYCLKNYYIKRANEVADGKLIPKWKHEWELEKVNETYSENTGAMARINDMEERVEVEKTYSVNLEQKLFNLQNKLDTINRISE
jgi:hypothetical protein